MLRQVAEEGDPTVAPLRGGARQPHALPTGSWPGRCPHRGSVVGGRRRPPRGRPASRCAGTTDRSRWHDDESVDAARAIMARATSRSCAGSSSRLVARPRRPRCSGGIVDGPMDRPKNGLATSSSTRPSTPRAASCASQAGGGQVGPVVQLPRGTLDPLGQLVRYPVSPLTTRETVLMLTPASAATSRMVARLPDSSPTPPALALTTLSGPVANHRSTIGHGRPDHNP